MLYPALATAWLAVGLVAVAVMRRRGHDTYPWAILFLVLGPLALPVAVSSDRHPPPQPDFPTHEGRLDLLVAHDGSADATAALRAALEMLGTQVTSLTLAAIVDLEAASTVRGQQTQRETKTRLDSIAQGVTTMTTAPVDTVVLFGKPPHALQHFAAEHGYELIVTASCCCVVRSHHARRRAAKKPATTSPVPVFVAPVYA